MRRSTPQYDLALVVKKEWLDLILSGQKTWEIRGTSTKNRRMVRLAQRGSGTLVGEVRIIDCVRVNLEDLPHHFEKHRISEIGTVKYRVIYAWVLEGAVRYPEPKPYVHPKGAITWIRLDAPSTLRDTRLARTDGQEQLDMSMDLQDEDEVPLVKAEQGQPLVLDLEQQKRDELSFARKTLWSL